VAEHKDTYNAAAEPVRIGIISDMPTLLAEEQRKVTDLVVEEYRHRLHRPVQIDFRRFVGAPVAPTRRAVETFTSMVDDGCLIVVGGNHSDNCRVMVDHANRLQVPLVTLGATEGTTSEYAFTVGWGYIPADAYLLANWCAQNGYRRVTLTSDTAWHCREYVRYFRAACERWNIRLLSDAVLSEFAGPAQMEQARQVAREHQSLNPDAIVHFGSSSAAEAWVLAGAGIGWQPPRAMNAVYFRISQPLDQSILTEESNGAALAEAREGWIGTSVVDEDNQAMRHMVTLYEARYGAQPVALDGAVNYYDCARTALEAVIAAPILSPQGVKEGLEQIKWLSAAAGGDANVISFGPWDHMGMKGRDSYVLRRIEDGRSVFHGRYKTIL
jgi:ABC-type branched-subunit amino acid transport system substrate-binding protein